MYIMCSNVHFICFMQFELKGYTVDGTVALPLPVEYTRVALLGGRYWDGDKVEDWSALHYLIGMFGYYQKPLDQKTLHYFCNLFTAVALHMQPEKVLVSACTINSCILSCAF